MACAIDEITHIKEAGGNHYHDIIFLTEFVMPGDETGNFHYRFKQNRKIQKSRRECKIEASRDIVMPPKSDLPVFHHPKGCHNIFHWADHFFPGLFKIYKLLRSIVE